MQHIVERRLQLARTRADCFRYLQDFSSCEQWDPGVARAEKTSAGAVAPGTHFQVQLRMAGRTLPMHYQLRAQEPGQWLQFDGEGQGFTACDEIRFLARGAQHTEIHYRATLRWPRLPGATRALLRPWLERIGDQAMAGLRQALEGDGPRQLRPQPRLAERLLLPAAAEFTARGYRRMPSRGLSRSVEGQVIAITGATSGLGLAMGQLLGRLGARLLLIGRDPARLAAAQEAIEAFAGATEITLYEAELSRLSECRRVADHILQTQPRLDVLINNAGVLPLQRTLTPEGHEQALAVNLLAPYVLGERLLPALRQQRGRLINVVSGGLYLQNLRLDDLEFASRPYDGAKAYAQAKRALLAVSAQWAQDERAHGVAVHCMHPGWADTPGVARSLPGFRRLLGTQLRDARMGADTAVWLATHPQLGASSSGQLWFDRLPRPFDVLPGTRVSDAQRAALLRHLAALQ